MRAPTTSAGAAGGLRHRVRMRSVVAASVVALTVGWLAAPAASAHNVLLSTSPANGAQVSVTPSLVTLTFDRPALAIGTQLVVNGPSGQQQDGPARLVDNTVSEALHPHAPAGAYTVLWRVTSADGHPISGSFRFTSAAAGTSTAPPAATVPPAAGTSKGGGPGLWVWVLLGVVVAAVVVAVAWRLGGRSRKRVD